MSELICIGTSDAFGSGGRRQSAYLIRGPAGGLLVDCGQTTGSGLAALGISSDEIDTIVVSHFHADHFGGVPLLLLGAQYKDTRRKPLRIAGPPQIEARIRQAAQALGHPIEGQEWSFPIFFQEIGPGPSHELGPARVKTFATRHSPESHPHGLVIDVDSQRIVYSGDTGWFDELPRQVGDADLFICECTLLERGYPFHLSLEEIADYQEHFACQRMVLSHLGEEVRSLTDPGPHEFADDGLVIKL